MNLYHAIMLRGNRVIYLPTSLPQCLVPFIDPKRFIKDNDIEALAKAKEAITRKMGV